MSICRSWSCRSTQRWRSSTARYLEASLDLGASQWQTFFQVLVPLALPGIVSGTLLVFIISPSAPI